MGLNTDVGASALLIQDQEQPESSTSNQQTQDDSKNLPDISSVITQVQSNSQDIQQVQLPDRSLSASLGIKQRLQHFFCCILANQEQQYVQAGDDVYSEAIREQKLKQQSQEYFDIPQSQLLIGPKQVSASKTLVLDLDETLVHSTFKPVPNPDYIIPVDIEGRQVDVYVIKRPWVDEFMQQISSKFEIIVFTASLAKYADPLLDQLDVHNCVQWRLFREACSPFQGNYVKDLRLLGRQLSQIIIIDNSPNSYIFQPENAIPVSSFIDDSSDIELKELAPVLDRLADVDDVRQYIGHNYDDFRQGQQKILLDLDRLNHDNGDAATQQLNTPLLIDSD